MHGPGLQVHHVLDAGGRLATALPPELPQPQAGRATAAARLTIAGRS